jgi:hypothetical protein
VGKKSLAPPPLQLKLESGRVLDDTMGGSVVKNQHIGKISKKWYQCECGDKFLTETNHWGRIYVGCKRQGVNYSTGHGWADCIHAQETLLQMAKQPKE